MRSERICSLARYVIADAMNPAYTAYNQWFERTLDDSAGKRISVPEAFLAVDAILNIYLNIASGIQVYDKVIAKHVQEELPFMATENIMMDAVHAWRQPSGAARKNPGTLHCSWKDGQTGGKPNDLIDRIAADPAFGLTREQILENLDASRYIGRCPEQVTEFLSGCVSLFWSAITMICPAHRQN